MSNYQPSRSGLRQVGLSADMSRAMQQAAQTGRAWAESNSPRVTGTYAGGFRVRPATVRGGRSNEDRAGAVLENTVPYAGIVEHHHGVLSRAVNVIENQR